MIEKVLYGGLVVELGVLGYKIYELVQSMPKTVLGSSKWLLFGCLIAVVITPVTDCVKKVNSANNSNSSDLKNLIKGIKKDD